MTRTLAPMPHPDWFWALSGGLDSTAAFLATKDIYENYRRRPIALYHDTRIGLPLNRLYVEELCDRYGQQLWTLRTHERFEDRVAEYGAPGAGFHSRVRNRLKGRQAAKIDTLADNPIHILGIRQTESEARAGLGKVRERDGGRVEVYPVYGWTTQQTAQFVLSHDDCPLNPCWVYRHFTDCGCLCYGDPSELDRVEDRFSWFGQRLREIEEAAAAAPDGGDVLGWSGLAGDAAEGTDDRVGFCSGGCPRETETTVQQALSHVIEGGSRAEAIAMLDDADDPESSGRTLPADAW